MAAPNYDDVMMPGAGGIRIPTEVLGSGGAGNPGATFEVVKQVSHSYGSAHADWNLAPYETAGSYFIVTSASQAANAVFPAAQPGAVFTVYNNSGYTITFKVSGQTGVGVTNGKRAILVCGSTDIARVTADT